MTAALTRYNVFGLYKHMQIGGKSRWVSLLSRMLCSTLLYGRNKTLFLVTTNFAKFQILKIRVSLGFTFFVNIYLFCFYSFHLCFIIIIIIIFIIITTISKMYHIYKAYKCRRKYNECFLSNVLMVA